MKIRKKIMIGVGIFLVFMLLVGGYGFVSACGPFGDGGGGFHSRFHGGGFRPSFCGKGISEFIFWRMDKRAETLNLTEVQKEKYETLKGHLKNHFSEGMADHHRLKKQFHEEIGKDNPDVLMLLESVKTKIGEISAFADQSLNLLTVFYESLDGTQQGMLTDEIKKRIDCRQP